MTTHVLLLDDENDPGTLERLKHTIRVTGYAMVTPVSGLDGLRVIGVAEVETPGNGIVEVVELAPDVPLPHAAARLARAVASVLDAPKDPRTITLWSRLIATSPGALRNWSRSAGLPPRRSLVFARLLRAVSLSASGRHKPENLLDVVDRRTVGRLLTFAGLPSGTFPSSIDDFLRQQTLIRDPEALSEILRVIGRRMT
jgi:hypothetical protein